MSEAILGILLVVGGVLSFLAAGPVRRKLAEQRAAAVTAAEAEGKDAPEQGAGRMAPLLLRLGGAAAVIVGLVTTVGGMAYTQDVGEVKVLRSFTGEVAGVDTSEGLAFKAPWVETVDFDVRNQQAIYKGEGYPTSEGEMVNGPEITFQDQDKVTGNADIAIRYSIDPGAVGEIYMEYPTQEALTARLIDQDMRSVVRNAFSGYTTAGVLERRGELEQDIRKGLEGRWEGTGVIVESVALQGIRYPQSTQDGFAQAQESATALKKAQADLEVRKAEAEQRKVVAQGEADANRILSESLTPEVLQQQYNETLVEVGKGGNLVVVPEGSTPMIDTGRSDSGSGTD